MTQKASQLFPENIANIKCLLTFFLPRYGTVKTNYKKNYQHQTFDISMTTAENVCFPISNSANKTSFFRAGRISGVIKNVSKKI